MECPSLSPDGRLIAYKSRQEHGFQPATWQLRVLDLATLVDRPLTEARSIDDQVAWVDDAHVAYGVQERRQASTDVDVWTATADGTGAPELLSARPTRPSWFP